MTSSLQVLLGLVALGLGWAALAVPVLWLGIRSIRSAPERAKVRAVPWAMAMAGWTGLLFGGVGFIWGAGVPDESAGAIAGALFAIGCLGGVLVGGLGAWVFITRRGRV